MIEKGDNIMLSSVNRVSFYPKSIATTLFVVGYLKPPQLEKESTIYFLSKAYSSYTLMKGFDKYEFK
ncbi:MAG TPA: hypothetical protein DDW93_06865 [Firmicutes bacterium]|jgi:hypothetical protein|nr:hypothetical protein [Bacillota bacterium]HBK68377.1 hypothetical protein [Bacillota bacterium]HBT15321.1 hypothetical protein [Bacillota bacterium]